MEPGYSRSHKISEISLRPVAGREWLSIALPAADRMGVLFNVPQAACGQHSGVKRKRVSLSKATETTITTVRCLAPLAINPQFTTLRAEIDIPNADADMVPAHVYGGELHTYELYRSPGPGGALLLFRPKAQVALPDQNMIGFRDVKIGVDDGDVVQIKSDLKEGDMPY